MEMLESIIVSVAAAIIVAVIVAAFRGLGVIRDMTSAVKSLTEAFTDHVDDANKYRKRIDKRLRDIERREPRLGWRIK